MMKYYEVFGKSEEGIVGDEVLYELLSKRYQYPNTDRQLFALVYDRDAFIRTEDISQIEFCYIIYQSKSHFECGDIQWIIYSNIDLVDTLQKDNTFVYNLNGYIPHNGGISMKVIENQYLSNYGYSMRFFNIYPILKPIVVGDNKYDPIVIKERPFIDLIRPSEPDDYVDGDRYVFKDKSHYHQVSVLIHGIQPSKDTLFDSFVQCED